MLTREHYIIIAKAVKQNTENNHLGDSTGKVFIDGLLEDLADYFKRDNPNFKRERFLKACL